MAGPVWNRAKDTAPARAAARHGRQWLGRGARLARSASTAAEELSAEPPRATAARRASCATAAEPRPRSCADAGDRAWNVCAPCGRAPLAGPHGRARCRSQRFLAREPTRRSSGSATASQSAATRGFATALRPRSAATARPSSRAAARAAGARRRRECRRQLSARVLRAEPNGGTPAACCARSTCAACRSGEAPFDFAPARRRPSRASSCRSSCATRSPALEIAERALGRRRRAGRRALAAPPGRAVVSARTADRPQPLLSPTYYVAARARALRRRARAAHGRGRCDHAAAGRAGRRCWCSPTSARSPRTRATGSRQFVEERRRAAAFRRHPARRRRTTTWCRCACAGAAARSAARCPGTRPSTLAPFDAREPVLRPRACRAISASAARSSPSRTADLPRKTWAALADGTPHRHRRAARQGLVVLFHVTADTTWSNLPLSGLFVDMLRRISALAGAARRRHGQGGRRRRRPVAAPLRTLDGFGAFDAPPATRAGRVADRRRPVRARASIRPASTARRTRRSRSTRWRPTTSSRPSISGAAASASSRSRAKPDRSTCGPGCSRSRCSASSLDTLAVALARGRLRFVAAARRPPIAAPLLGAGARAARLAAGAAAARPGSAAAGAPRRSARGARRRAGDPPRLCASPATPQVDETSRAGLTGLTRRCSRPAPRSTPANRRRRPGARRTRLLSADLLADRRRPAAADAKPRSASSTPS